MKDCFKKSRALLPVILFGCFYMPSFAWLEKYPGPYHIIKSSLDDTIPFCEYFIIPYLLWFFYIAGGILFFAFFNNDKKEYWRLLINLGAGMTLFLAVSYIYPNGLELRPHAFPRENIFTELVRGLYKIDTPTNVLPSIHVYNSAAVFCAVNSCRKLKTHKGIRFTALGLAVLIILSTMFLKQHSVYDVAAGLLCSAAAYIVLYRIPAGADARK